MQTMSERERELLVRELATVNAAIMTSFGSETRMLEALQAELRERLGLPATSDYQDDNDSYCPAA